MLRPAGVSRFRGLNLVTDPAELGWEHAVDLLNVDFDEHGRVRARDGAAVHTDAPAVAAYRWIHPFYTTGGAKHLVCVSEGANGKIDVIDHTGAVIATQAFANVLHVSFARIAAPTTEEIYLTLLVGSTVSVRKWNGSALSTPAAPTTSGSGATADWGRLIWPSSDNRLVIARMGGAVEGNSPSTLKVSNPNAPTTWNLSNYVEIQPGDGEELMGGCGWREFSFAFKETKFAVFAPPRADASGLPLLIPRLVTGEGLAARRGLAVSPHGVYFLNRRGVWLTRGGDPVLVSEAIDPIFRGTSVPLFQTGVLNQAYVTECALAWADNKLWVAYPSGGSTTNDVVLVYHPEEEVWTLYDFPATAMAPYRAGSREELAFGRGGSTAYLSTPALFFDSVKPSGRLTDSSNPSSRVGVLPSGSYRYRLTALNAAGETLASEEVTVDVGSQISDSFNSLANGDPLNLRLADAGGQWIAPPAPSGYLGNGSGNAQLTEGGASTRRQAILDCGDRAGTTTVGVKVAQNTNSLGETGVVVRWVDANNFAALVFHRGTSELRLITVVGGVETVHYSTSIGASYTNTSFHQYEVTAYANGALAGVLLYGEGGGVSIGDASVPIAALASGGALDSGKIGFTHFTSGASATLKFEDFYSSLISEKNTVVLVHHNVQGATSYRLWRHPTAMVAGGAYNYRALSQTGAAAVSVYDDGDVVLTPGTLPSANTASVAGYDVLLHGPDYYSDGGNGTTTGAAIDTRYQSGFSELDEPVEKIVRRWELDGTGTVDFAVSVDYSSPAREDTITFPGASAGGRANVNKSARGRQVSFVLSGDTVFSVSSVTAFVRAKARDT